MASRLLNRSYSVTWNDFRAQPPANATRAAHIETKLDLAYSYSSGQGGTQLADSVTVTVQLLGDKSWAKKTLIRSWSRQAQADLLLHEQGHFNITALMGRDMFIDLMALKGRSFSNPGALHTEVRRIAALYAPQPVHTKYDSMQETNHGKEVTPQTAWNGYIQMALTHQRTPAVAAPDGTAYKVRLREVLKRAGKG
jgi:hypothetical protein